jgi:ribosomal protein L11 methylase PrmA
VFEVEVEVDVEVDVDAGGGLEVRAEVGSGLAEQVWEEGHALYVSEAGGRLLLGFAERAPAEAAARRLGGVVVDLDAAGRRDLDTWRAWARPTRIGRLVVRPAWHASAAPGADRAGVEIAVDPGHAFGHGGHPSTRLVLEALEQRLEGGESVLDVGCGSGVLSVAAVALGAESARAIDIDPTAIAVTRANALANRVSRRIDADSTPLAAIRRRFDVVVANIGVVVLREVAPLLVERIDPGGWLALSGLLEHQWQEVVDVALAAAGRAAGELRLDGVGRAEGWATPILTVGRPAPPPGRLPPAPDGPAARGRDAPEVAPDTSDA